MIQKMYQNIFDLGYIYWSGFKDWTCCKVSFKFWLIFNE